MVDRKERKSVFLRRYLSPLPKLKSLLAPPRGNKISTCCCPGLSVLAKDPRRRGECRFLFYYLETARETDPSHGRSQRFSFSLPLSFSFYGLEWFCSVLIEEESLKSQFFSSRVSVRARVYVFFVILFEDEQLKIFRIRSVFHFLVKQLTLLFSSK